MILSFHPCFAADTQIILADRTLGADDLRLIREAHAIILPQSCSRQLYQACKSYSALLFPNYDMKFEYPGKIGQSLLIRKLGCPQPETMTWPSVEVFRNRIGQKQVFPHPVPFLIKEDWGHEADGVHLIRDEKALNSALERIILLERSGQQGFITQGWIASEGNVLRAVILGKKIITYWKRPDQPDGVITTISRGARIDELWRPDLQAKGEVQAQRLSASTGINLAAIDYVFSLSDPDPQPLFLEINYYFGRRGLGGSLQYYRLLYRAIQEWLSENGFDPNGLDLV